MAPGPVDRKEPAAAGSGPVLHDLTVALEPDVDPWPGDVGYAREVTARIADGASVNLGAFRTSLHNGTHADAPLHVRDGAPDAASLPLEAFIGPAVVLPAPEAFALEGRALAEAVPEGARVLLRSGRADFRRFPRSWPAVPAAWIERLAARGVPLLGTDAPSVDPAESRTLEAHHACLESGILIVENLVLTEVVPGPYELVALPLRLAGADAAPLRAVLRERPARRREAGEEAVRDEGSTHAGG